MIFSPPQLAGHRRHCRRASRSRSCSPSRSSKPSLAEAERELRAALPAGAGGASPPPSPITAPPPSRPRRRPGQCRARRRRTERTSTKGPRMTSKPALPLLALPLSACASQSASRSRSRCWPKRSMPGLFPLPPRGAAQAAGQDRLPQADALTATEQAIQLDELIKWVRKQAAVDNNPKAVRRVREATNRRGLAR